MAGVHARCNSARAAIAAARRASEASAAKSAVPGIQAVKSQTRPVAETTVSPAAVNPTTGTNGNRAWAIARWMSRRRPAGYPAGNALSANSGSPATDSPRQTAAPLNPPAAPSGTHCTAATAGG